MRDFLGKAIGTLLQEPMSFTVLEEALVLGAQPPCPGCIRGILWILLVKKGQGSTASNKSMPEALPPLPQHFRSTRMWASMQEATTCICFAESPRLGTGQRRSWVHGHSLCGMYEDEDHKVLSSRGLAVAGDTATSHKNS